MTSIYLGNLSWGLDEEMLGQAISDTAEATSVEIKRNKIGKSLGYAIASFATADDAQAVIAALHGTNIDGREINCREDRGARAKPERQERAPREQQPEPVASNRVFVGNLSWDTADDVLLDIFAEYNVVSATVQYQSGGASKGWALVEFADTNDAENAINSMNGAELDGREIVCRGDRGPPASRGGRNQPRKAREPRAPRERRVIAPGPPSTSVFIGNLSWEVNDAGLEELLAGFSVTQADVQTRPDGKSRGFALVQFETLEEAQRAIDELNGQPLLDRDLVLKFDAKQ